MFRLYATGDYSLTELHSTMAAKGLTSSFSGKAPSRSKMAEMLADPFYVGIVEWNGVQYPGQHKPIVSRAMFAKVQEVLRAHNTAGVRERTHDHYLKGSTLLRGVPESAFAHSRQRQVPLFLLPWPEGPCP